MTTKATTSTKYYATKNFADAGTEKAFKRGDELKIDEGTALNYEAAGLASTEKPKDAEPVAEKADA